MQKVLIDIIVVPEESKAAFLERARQVQSILRDIPGFVEGYIYEQKEGDSRYNFVTTAVWESEEAIENAQKFVTSEFQRLGFNRQETARKLGIETIRSTYERSPY